MDKQCLKVKVDTNNHLNKVYPSFNRLYKKLLPEFHLVDNLTFLIVSFFKQNHNDIKAMKSHLWLLDNILEKSLNPNIILVVTDTSIKNNVTISIFYILSS